MTIEETREQILTDDAFVLSEVRKIQYLMGLKRVTRYNLARSKDDLTESVAEHVCGLSILAEYFLKIEAGGEKLQKSLILEHILFHDTDELETGDVPTNLKNDTDRQEALKLLPVTFAKSPEVLRTRMQELNVEYENQIIPEVRFVKALDKLEGVIHCYSDRQRPIFEHLKFTEEDQKRTKRKYIEPYPILFRFYEVISKEYKKGDFYYPSA
jgi:5'-deoxynucleotidase YfbR-like HD superfamily hydrolase